MFEFFKMFYQYQHVMILHVVRILFWMTVA